MCSSQPLIQHQWSDRSAARASTACQQQSKLILGIEAVCCPCSLAACVAAARHELTAPAIRRSIGALETSMRATVPAVRGAAASSHQAAQQRREACAPPARTLHNAHKSLPAARGRRAWASAADSAGAAANAATPPPPAAAEQQQQPAIDYRQIPASVEFVYDVDKLCMLRVSGKLPAGARLPPHSCCHIACAALHVPSAARSCCSPHPCRPNPALQSRQRSSPCQRRRAQRCWRRRLLHCTSALWHLMRR